MEKIKLNEFGVLEPIQPIIVNIKGIDVEVMPKLTYEQLLIMMNEIISIVVDDRPFISRPLYKIVKELVIVKYYTNIAITVFDAEYIMPDLVYEIYDILKQHGIIDAVLPVIEKDQLDFFEETLDGTITSIINYKNSAKGILDSISTDAETISKNLNDAMDIIRNPEELQEAKKFIDIASANS